ncbi:hypothetical protein MKW98_014017 [Papaver atlanticum]|uniref:Uncharacterized protein n=1 Tax=Papaver atlanticum TaxID=357466 RepID=A0AAD4SJ33_9MAGN|nr:hypothetical protein MKW98_014017 [Papaver atlanticum]
MRTGVTIIHRSLSTSSSAQSLSPSIAAAPIHSPWHSPIPYLFGGLAAMLGLIAFALLILACSYWKLSAFLDNDSERSRNDLENGDDDDKSVDQENIKVHVVYEEKIVVIMAGDVKPTYLATPIDYPKPNTTSENSKNEDEMMNSLDEKTKEEESDVRVETESRETIENPHQHHQNH